MSGIATRPTDRSSLAPLAVLLALALPGAAAAGGTSPTPPAPSVEELVAEALARSPDLLALRARVQAGREREAPAAALPDPMVEATLQNVGLSRYTVGEDENAFLGVMVRQGLSYPGKRAARRAAARAGTVIQAADLAARERAVATAVRSLYARLYTLDAEESSLAAGRELLDLLAATAESRYRAGEGGQEPLLKAQLEVSRLADRAAALGAERAGAVADLGRLLGRTVGPLGRVSRLPAAEPPAGPWVEAAVGRSPAVARARAEVESAGRRLEIARLDLRPDLSAAAGYAHRGGIDPMVTLSLGVELPFWRRKKQEPLRRAAEQELAAARQELAAAESSARAAALGLAARWSAARERGRLYREGILPQTAAAMDAARVSYLNGRGDFTTLVQDFGLWLTARTELAAREAEGFTAWAEIEELLPGGGAPGDTP